MSRSLLKNTLLSPLYIDRISMLPRQEATCASLVEIVTQFQQMKAFASEIHTELQLVKPLLKILGYAVESKPKFFEEQIKDPDFALFGSEEQRIRSSRSWGTRAYYNDALAVMLVKRYGRNLREGISGFYLAFENRIPLYQVMYLTKKSGTPWGILTNGKNWLLLKRPFAFEKPILEIDVGEAVLHNDREAIHLFSHIFSFTGLDETLPDLLEKERTESIKFLKEKRSSLARALDGASKRTEVYRIASALFSQFFPEGEPAGTEIPQKETGAGTVTRPSGPGNGTPIKDHDQPEVFTYLLARGISPALPNFEAAVLGSVQEDATKDNLLSLKILDMTPGFGNVGIELVQTLAYLSFLLPYREKNSFVAEWENERLLNRFILNNVLFGIEKYQFSLDVLQNAMQYRFNSTAVNYRLGNPLLGMSIRDLQALTDDKSQAGLFSKNPGDVISELKEMYRLYFSLSDRIKEDAAAKSDLDATLRIYRQRIREVMDLITASYFDKTLEIKKIRELLYYMDGDETVWEAARRMDWYAAARDMAERRHFFHMEIEFPFLLNGQFDLIVIQPTLNYLWEEKLPPDEATKAYIKRAVTYLKQKGKILLIGENPDELVSELKRSRRYAVEATEGVVAVRRR
jgi:hypothetical protein